MAKRTEHTPTLPWKADESDDYWILGGVLSGKVAEVTFPEDRPLVVRAVNCHADLVAALEAVEWVYDGAHNNKFCPTCAYEITHGHAKDCQLAAALAKARLGNAG